MEGSYVASTLARVFAKSFPKKKKRVAHQTFPELNKNLKHQNE